MTSRSISSSSRKAWKPDKNQENGSRLKRVHSSPVLTMLGAKRNNSNNFHSHTVSVQKKSKKSKSMSSGNISGGLNKTIDNGKHAGFNSSSESSPNEEEDDDNDEDDEDGIDNKLTLDFCDTITYYMKEIM
jgi:hypothetical protein